MNFGILTCNFHFSDVNSIFEDFFGEGFGSSSQQQHQKLRGSDLRYNMSISLHEAFTGKKTQIRIPSSIDCDSCNGTGGAGGSKPSTCPTCNGYGKVRQSSGFFTIERSCSVCGGVGETITNPCLKCSGTGQIKKQKTISVSIPSGVDDSTTPAMIIKKSKPMEPMMETTDDAIPNPECFSCMIHPYSRRRF